jgi:hypothetical protein
MSQKSEVLQTSDFFYKHPPLWRNVFFVKSYKHRFIGKTGGAEAIYQGDPLIFRSFPALKSGGGDKGVGF